MTKLKILSFLWILSFFGCDKPISDIPTIRFVSNSKSVMVQNGQDSTFVKFEFEDGDGDIGSDMQDNIFIKDARNGQIIAQRRLPNYTTNPIYKKGEITLVIHAPCCIYPNGTACTPNTTVLQNKTKFILQIQDNAGNYSNEISTPEITLDCL